MSGSAPRRIDLPEGLPVRLRTFIVTGKGLILNLSATGAYVATPMFLLPQAQVRLQIVLREEKRWFEVDAVVVWENRGTVGRRDGLPPGYGMRFVDASPETASVIESLLSGGRSEAPERVQPAPPTEETRIDVPADLLGDDFESPPFRLIASSVRSRVPRRKPGIFVLSYDRTQEARVGRADEDLQTALSEHEGSYAFFYFEVIENDEDRYFRECELFHRLGGDRGQLDHSDHPVAPASVTEDCPVCVSEGVR